MPTPTDRPGEAAPSDANAPAPGAGTTDQVSRQPADPQPGPPVAGQTPASGADPRAGPGITDPVAPPPPDPQPGPPPAWAGDQGYPPYGPGGPFAGDYRWWRRERRRWERERARSWARWRGASGDTRGGWRGRAFQGPPDARRPPWWPDGEPWPPAPGEWTRMRSRFVRGIGCVFVAVLALGVTGAIGSAWLLVTVLDVATGTSQPALVPLAAGMFIAALVLLAVVGAVSHGMRGVTNSVADLIDASQRVQAGDYTVRAPIQSHTPGPVRALVRSFNTMTERLESDEQQRRTLLADISHELRTPLTVLQGELEAIVDGVYPADEAHLATTLEETRVLGRLIDDLRTLALAEAGTLALHREPTDLGVLVEEVAAAFRTAADAASATVSTSVSDDIPLLEVDPVRIREVLGNLVGNALRYAPAGSVVAVSALVSGPGRIAVSVHDDGPGIPAELLPHVFERFAKSPESRGSGLGLAIARQLVEAHGGRIAAESARGAGTTIRFELPVASAP